MIDYIELKKTKRPVKFGLNTLRIFSKQYEITLTELGNLGDMTFDALLNLMYLGLSEGAKADGQQFLASVDDVCDWLDESGKLDEMLTIFADQFGGGGEDEGNQEAPAKG